MPTTYAPTTTLGLGTQTGQTVVHTVIWYPQRTVPLRDGRTWHRTYTPEGTPVGQWRLLPHPPLDWHASTPTTALTT